MEQRVSLITLGVVDMDASAAFYDAMGWKRVETDDGVVAYDLLGQTLGSLSARDACKRYGARCCRTWRWPCNTWV